VNFRCAKTKHCPNRPLNKIIIVSAKFKFILFCSLEKKVRNFGAASLIDVDYGKHLSCAAAAAGYSRFHERIRVRGMKPESLAGDCGFRMQSSLLPVSCYDSLRCVISSLTRLTSVVIHWHQIFAECRLTFVADFLSSVQPLKNFVLTTCICMACVIRRPKAVVGQCLTSDA
jgi:hypothetical protein